MSSDNPTDLGNEVSNASSWRVEPNFFLVSGNGLQIEIQIFVGGLKFTGQMQSGEHAEIQLGWDGTMEFVEWVHHRLPLAET